MTPSLNTTVTSLPSLNDIPSQLSAGSSTTQGATSAPEVATVIADFPNPFPEGPENVIDQKTNPPQKLTVSSPALPIPAEVTSSPQAVAPLIESPPKVETPAVDTPASVKVEPAVVGKTDESSEVSTEPAQIETTESGGDPFAVDAKNFVEPIIVDDKVAVDDPTAPSLNGTDMLSSGAPSELRSDARSGSSPSSDASLELRSEEGAPNGGDESRVAKMQKIQQRLGMKGLKGFCPVTLRDERELVDAKPEFHFTHRRQKFHFTSAEARDKFEANPLRYKPAAYGADVVSLSRDKEVVEGTLDFAAWYKGRLFLFSSRENYDIFLKDPTQYATIEEFE
jgi:YHS domain-containing protein